MIMMSQDSRTVLSTARALDHSDAIGSMRKTILLLAATVPDWPLGVTGLGVVLVRADRNSIACGQSAVVWDDAIEDCRPYLTFARKDQAQVDVVLLDETAFEVAESLRTHPRKYLVTADDDLTAALRKSAFGTWLQTLTCECLGDSLGWEAFIKSVRPQMPEHAPAGGASCHNMDLPNPGLAQAENTAPVLPPITSLPQHAAMLVEIALAAEPSNKEIASAPATISERLVSVTARGVAGCGPFDLTVDIPKIDGQLVSVPRWAVDAMWANLSGKTRTSFGRTLFGRGITAVTSYLGNAGVRPPSIRSTHALGDLDGTLVVSKTWTPDKQPSKDGQKTFYKVNSGGRSLTLPDGTRLDDAARDNWLKRLPMEERGWVMYMKPSLLREILLKATGGGPLGRERATADAESERLTAAIGALNSILETDVPEQQMLQLRQAMDTALRSVTQAQSTRTDASERLEAARLQLEARLEAAGDTEQPSGQGPDQSMSVDECDEVVRNHEANVVKLESEPRPGPGADSVAHIEYLMRALGNDSSERGRECLQSVVEMLALAKRHERNDHGKGEHALELDAARDNLRSALGRCVFAARSDVRAADADLKMAEEHHQQVEEAAEVARNKHDCAADVRALSNTARPIAAMLAPKLERARQRLRDAESAVEDELGASKAYHDGPLADFVRNINAYLSAVCTNVTVRAYDDDLVFEIDGTSVDNSQLDAQTHSVVSLAYRASLRMMGVAEYSAHYYAVVDSSDVCGIWTEGDLRALLRALVSVGGYGGVLCVDLPLACVDTTANVSGASADDDDVGQVDAGRVRFCA